MDKSSNVADSIENTRLSDKRRRNWFWDHNEVSQSSLSTYAKLVRLYLARCANADRVAWPSLTTIAQHCGISRSSENRAVKELVEAGWLEKQTRQRPDGSFQSTFYILTDPPADLSSQADELQDKTNSSILQTLPHEDNSRRRPPDIDSARGSVQGEDSVTEEPAQTLVGITRAPLDIYSVSEKGVLN
jgi:DNA-binding MarR family transcriptional regulator